MTWINDLVLRRRAQATTVFVVETFDLKRIDEFKQVSQKVFPEHDVYRLDVQTGLVEKNGQPYTLSPDLPLIQNLTHILSESKAVLIISYILVQEQAQTLNDAMLSWHQSGLYGSDRLNTVAVFTASADYFPTTLRRFVHTINIPAAAPEERSAILNKITEDMHKAAAATGRKLALQVDDSMINASAGLTLQDIESVAMESVFKHQTFKVEEFTRRKMEILKQYGVEYIEPKRGFETVAGYSALKNYVTWRIAKPLQQPQTAAKYGITIPKGMLLIGTPGVGKTYFSKALAKEIGLTMLKITPGDFLTKYVGESEARVRQITQLIETISPCIVFMDEFDQVALERATTMVTDSGASRRVQNMLLDWLGDENRKSFIIGATNFAHLDKAFIRPGRIDEVLVMLPPDAAARQDILRIHSQVIRKVPLDPDVDAFQWLAAKTKWWSGAELEKLVLDAAALAFRDSVETVTTHYFDEAYRGFEINIQERQTTLNTLLGDVRHLEQYNKAFLDTQLAEFEQDKSPQSRVEALFKDTGSPPDHGVGVA